MDENDLLFTTAEVGIAIAGFAGLASVIDRGRPGYDPKVDSLRLRMMLEVSLLVVAFALLPAFASTVVSSEVTSEASETALRASSVIFGASFAAYNVYVAARYFRSDVKGMDPVWYMGVWGVLTAPTSLGLLYAGISLSTTACTVLYFVSLYYLLVLSGTQFLRLLVSILRSAS